MHVVPSFGRIRRLSSAAESASVRRVGSGLLLSVLALPLWSCTDGASAPEGFEFNSTVSIALEVVFPGGASAPPAVASAMAVGPQAVDGEPRPINRIRVRAFQDPGGATLGSAVIDVNPSDPNWEVPIDLELPSGSGVRVLFEIELVAVVGGREFVEWSGRAGPVGVSSAGAGRIEQIEVFRGPLDNLSVTGVEIDNEGPVAEGGTRQLSTTIATTGSTPTVAWISLDPGIATVTGTGLVTGVAPGVARIRADAGPASDTEEIPVTAVATGVRVNPPVQTVDAIGATAPFTAELIDLRGDPVPGGDPFAWQSLNPAVAQHIGGGVFQALSGGQATVEATSATDPTFSSTAIFDVVLPGVDVSVTKTADRTTAEPGDVITWTVTVSNAGPATAADVVVVDVVGPGHSLNGAIPTKGALNGTTWEVGSLAAGEDATLTVTTVVEADAGDEVTNTVQASDRRGAPDADDGNNTATASVEIVRQNADLQIEKSIDSDFGPLGGVLEFVVRVHNAGPGTARNIQVGERPDPGITFVNADFQVGAVNLSTGGWTIGELAPGETAVLYLYAELSGVAGQRLTNRVSVSTDESTVDPDPSNNQSQVSFVLIERQANIRVEKEVDYCYYDVSLPARAEDERDGRRRASWPKVAGDRMDRAGIDARPDGTTLDTYYYCYGGGFYGYPGEVVAFKITVYNDGPDPVDGVVVRDIPGEGFGEVEDAFTEGDGSIDEVAGTWTTGPLGVEDSDELFILIRLDFGTGDSYVENFAGIQEVIGAIDTNPEDNEDTAEVYVEKPDVDLSVMKTASTSSAYIGDTITFTITVENDCCWPAFEPIVRELPGAGWTVIEMTSDIGNVNFNDLSWTIDLLDEDDVATITVKAIATTDGTLTNSVEIDDARLDYEDECCGQLADNVASVDVDIMDPMAGGPLPASDDLVTAGNTVLVSPGRVPPSGPTITWPNNLFGGASVGVDAGNYPTSGGGELIVEPDGEFEYIPPVGFAGSDMVTFSSGGESVTVDILVEELVWYFDNTAGAGGTGRSLEPFNTLGAAETAAGVGDVIMALLGDGSTTGATTGITLQDSQKLFGETCGLTLGLTTLGTTEIVPSGGARTQITNVGGNGVTLADHATICGLEIASPSGSGVFGSSITDPAATNLSITSPGSTGFEVDVGTDVLFTSSTITSAGTNGIDVADVSNFDMTSITVNSATEIGIAFAGLLGSDNAWSTIFVNGSGAEQVHGSWGTGEAGELTWAGGTMNSGLDRGIFFETSGGGDGLVTMSSVFSNTGAFEPLWFEAGGTSTLGVSISDGGADNNANGSPGAAGMQLVTTGTGSLQVAGDNLLIEDSPHGIEFAPAPGAPIDLSLDDSLVRRTGGLAGSRALWLPSTADGGDVTISLTDTDFTGWDASAFLAATSGAPGTPFLLDVTVGGGVGSSFAASGSGAFGLAIDAATVGFGATTVCLDFANSTFTGGSGGTGLYLEQAATAVFGLANFDTDAGTTFFNQGVAASVTELGTIGSGGPCRTPTLPVI